MSSEDQKPEANGSIATIVLLSLASLSALGYALLLRVSNEFGSDTKAVDRPTLDMLTLFGALFIAHWIAIYFARRLPSTATLAVGIFAAACLFRGIFLNSIPMHEIDIYRYVWDGAVFAEGVSPYRYAPQQVKDAALAGGAPNDPTLQQLVELQASSQSLYESLDTIHYGHYPSPYPIVSQAVFALSAKITPDSVTTHRRMVIMKGLLVLMDLATLVVVMLLLRELNMHLAWSIAYGWCPLVLKEVANGGHLDSIAIFFSTCAIWLLVRSVRKLGQPTPTISAGIALALAIGAKLYPVILVPLFVAVWFRRCGWKIAAIGLATTGILSIALLYPLLGPGQTNAEIAAAVELQPGELNQPPDAANQIESDDGIQAFLEHWEMNDLLFMVVLENLRPQAEVAEQYQPWFVFTSDEWAKSIVTAWAKFKGENKDEQGAAVDQPLSSSQLKRESFSLARAITGGWFFIFACVLAWIAAGKEDGQKWCQAAMLTLAWFWLTCPTQNPWYWCWVVPLLPFAVSRTWHAVAAVTMLYYLRFWLTAQYPRPEALGTAYNGEFFFYFVIAWVEFVPILAGLTIEWLTRRQFFRSKAKQ